MSEQSHQSDPRVLSRRTLERDHRRLAAILRPGMAVARRDHQGIENLSFECYGDFVRHTLARQTLSMKTVEGTKPAA